MLKTIILFLTCFFISILTIQAENLEYPGRVIYPEVTHISTEEFRQEYDQAIIIDTRSILEYETIHVLNASRYGIHDRNFSFEIKKIRNKNPDKKIIFYCNGKTCMKSYKAAKKAMKEGIENVFAYDSGIFEWAEAHPNLAALIGKSPVNLEQLNEHKKRFNQHVLSITDFVDKVYEKDTIVFDIRNNRERFNSSPLFLLKDKSLSLSNPEKFIKKLKRLKDKDKTLLFYDMSGRTVIWLEFYLADIGIKNYSFMEGGVYAYSKFKIENHFFQDHPKKKEIMNKLFTSKKS